MSDEIEQKTKQSFTKMATTKKRKKKRTWVITYRLVDGPPVDLAKSDAAQKRKRKAERAKRAKDSE
jgi:hypothetical protein